MLPITTVPPDPPTYQTTELCVQAALEAARQAGQLAGGREYEYGGVIVSDGAVCTYTTPATIHDAYHVAYRAQVGLPWHILGVYHTHPAEQWPQFSDDDKVTAKRLHLPSWIMATWSGRIAEYQP